MTPEEKAVIECAEKWRDEKYGGGVEELKRAVDTLRGSRKRWRVAEVIADQCWIVVDTRYDKRIARCDRCQDAEQVARALNAAEKRQP